MLLKLKGFKYATSLDLHIGHYHIKLCSFSRKPCTIVLPWSEYEYQKLLMGLCNSPDIFQGKMNKLFNGLEFVTTHIGDLLVISNKSFEHRINKLDKVLSELNQKGFKVNVEKSFFARNEPEYLGSRITRQGILPLSDEVEAIKNIAVPNTKNSLEVLLD